jgi:hypothetical protein
MVVQEYVWPMPVATVVTSGNCFFNEISLSPKLCNYVIMYSFIIIPHEIRRPDACSFHPHPCTRTNISTGIRAYNPLDIKLHAA